MSLREEILAGGFDLANRDDGAIASALSASRTAIVSRPIGIGTILAVMAPNGGAFLDALEAMAATDSNVKWALKMIEAGTFDVGMEVTRQQLQQFAAANVSMEPAINALLAMAVEPQTVTAQEVARALEGL